MTFMNEEWFACHCCWYGTVEVVGVEAGALSHTCGWYLLPSNTSDHCYAIDKVRLSIFQK